MNAKPENKNLSPCHCINLRRVTGAVTEHYNRALAPTGLTVNQFSLLWNLEFLGQSNMTTLASRACLDNSTLARNLKPLLEKGFIVDKAPGGQRDRLLSVTPKGQMALEIGIPIWKNIQSELKNAIGPEDMAVFKKVLGKLLEI